jgi:hypothetical protein
VSVHHIYVDAVGTGFFSLGHLITQARKISCKD